MIVKCNKEFAVASIDVREINCLEMRQMYELKERIEAVLNSHKGGENERKIFVSDEDLTFMHAVLSVFTKEYQPMHKSAFDDFLNSTDKERSIDRSSQSSVEG